MEKCYRVEFTAHLHKLTLALKMECGIEVIWKRGEKTGQSGKVKLVGGEAVFQRKITISCNMLFNTKTKIFQEKITMFSIILTSEKGTKQAGEIEFDVAQYINERQLNNKNYELRLSGCPDKNARLSFSLTGALKQQISPDAISDKSYVSPNIPVSQLGPNQSMISVASQNNQMPVSTQDKSKPVVSGEKIKNLEDENKRIKQQLKAVDKLKRENDELRKKIKNEEYKKAIQIKQKIQKYKTEIERMKGEIRTNKKIEEETQKIEGDILKCKIKIMKAFNYAAEVGDGRLVDSIQDYCGILEK